MGKTTPGTNENKHFRLIRSDFDNKLLSTLELAFNTNGIYKFAFMWLLHFFMKNPAATALNSRIALLSKFNSPWKEVVLTIL